MTDEERRRLIDDISDTVKAYAQVVAALGEAQDDRAIAGITYTCGLSMGLASRVGIRFGEDLERWGETVRMRKAGELSDEEWLRVTRAVWER